MSSAEPWAENGASAEPGRHGLARALQLAWIVALVGLPLGLLLALADVRPYPHRLALLQRLLDLYVFRGLGYAAAGVAVWLVVFAALGRPVPAPPWRARLAALPAWAYAQTSLVGYANLELLPGLSDAARGVIHASLAVALLAVFEAVIRRLLVWRERELVPGRRPPLAGLAVAAAIVVCMIPLGLRARVLDDRPNVIVILLDVLGAQHLGTYGYAHATSPNIDAFARDAVVFEQAISQSTFTKTSVSSLFSSLYPFRHGVYHGKHDATAALIESDVLDAQVTTLAEALRAVGYFTIGWVQNSQIRGYMGFDQGFELYRDQRGRFERMLRDVVPWLETFGSRMRFFAYVHVIDIHAPYAPEPPFDRMFGADDERYFGWDGKRWHDFKADTRAGRVEPTPEAADQLRALYDGEIAYVDAMLGEVFDVLRREGLYDDAIVVLTGDHGEAFLQHGAFGHSSTPFEELIHVPLIVKLPRSEGAGRRVAEPVALVDVAPTLLALVGAPPLEDVDGVSLVSQLRGEPRAGRGRVREIVSEYDTCVAIRTDAWKYLSCHEREPELYDLKRDPGESTNVIADHPEVAAELGPRAAAAWKLRAAPRERVVVDPETVEALKALGYL